MKTWNVQVSASNHVEREFDTLKQALRWLRGSQGSCSIDLNHSNSEKFCGSVEQAINWIEFRIENQTESGSIV